MGTAGAGAPSRAGGGWFENPPSPRPAPSWAGRSCPRTFLPITFPHCLAASGGEQACALSVLAFNV